MIRASSGIDEVDHRPAGAPPSAIREVAAVDAALGGVQPISQRQASAFTPSSSAPTILDARARQGEPGHLVGALIFLTVTPRRWGCRRRP